MVSNLPTIITRTALYSSCSLELTITVRNIQLHDWQPRKGTAALRTRESLGRRRNMVYVLATHSIRESVRSLAYRESCSS
jgi:hypothetical protein